MGQKVHPICFRLGINQESRSRWFAPAREYARFVEADLLIRREILSSLSDALVEDVIISRPRPGLVEVTIRSGRPGLVIGEKGQNIRKLQERLMKIYKEKGIDEEIRLRTEEVADVDTSAALLAQQIAEQLERKVHHRRAMKRAMEIALEKGVKGIRVECKGRLAGAELARREWYQKGRLPRHTLRALIDYGFAEALTKYGKIGVKVWLYKGDKLPESAQKG
ncbi:MAG: 30S ribosomal protein S3 [bacterium JZ-2024 1]